MSIRHHRTAALAALLLAASTQLIACGEPADPQSVLIAATATANEPAPSLSPEAEQALQDAIESDDGAAYLITVRDGQPVAVDGQVDLRLLRDGTQEIENDESLRQLKTTALLDLLRGRVQAVDPDQGDLDLLTLLVGAGRHPGSATVIAISSGVQTRAPLDERVLGFDFDSGTVVDDLANRHLLPDLAGKTVIFIGLGDVAGAQPALTTSARSAVVNLWLTICRRAGAVSCAVDPTPVAPTPPVATTPVPVVSVPDPSTLSLDPIPAGDGTTQQQQQQSLPSELLFEPNQAALLPQAQDALAPLAARIIADRSEVHLVGHAWKVAENDDPGRADELSTLRAQAVRDLLVTLQVAQSQIVEVRGAGFAEPITPTDTTDPQAVAAANRVVQVTLVETAG